MPLFISWRVEQINWILLLTNSFSWGILAFIKTKCYGTSLQRFFVCGISTSLSPIRSSSSIILIVPSMKTYHCQLFPIITPPIQLIQDCRYIPDVNQVCRNQQLHVLCHVLLNIHFLQPKQIFILLFVKVNVLSPPILFLTIFPMMLCLSSFR